MSITLASVTYIINLKKMGYLYTKLFEFQLIRL
jgi:hypothetical protein